MKYKNIGPEKLTIKLAVGYATVEPGDEVRLPLAKANGYVDKGLLEPVTEPAKPLKTLTPKLAIQPEETN